MDFKSVERGYGNLWEVAELLEVRAPLARKIVERLKGNRNRYEQVSARTGVPWYWIAITHERESGANFSRHLHNGDPLSSRTRRVPAGRPTSGSPPFTWEESAIDALFLKDLHKVQNWTIPRLLYEFERYNGFGYFGKGINSPYVWSFTNLYSKGKYIADHKYSATAIDQQAGCAALLKACYQLGYIEKDDPMQKLESTLLPYGYIAPVLVQALTSELAPLVVKALAEAFNTDPDADKVSDALAKATLKETQEALEVAEEKVSNLTISQRKEVPAEQGPVEKLPPEKVKFPGEGLSPLDKLLGGEALKGLKTWLGTMIIGAGFVAHTLGYIDAQQLQAIGVVGGMFGATGLLAKFGRT